MPLPVIALYRYGDPKRMNALKNLVPAELTATSVLPYMAGALSSGEPRYLWRRLPSRTVCSTPPVVASYQTAPYKASWSPRGGGGRAVPDSLRRSWRLTSRGLTQGHHCPERNV